MVAQAQPAFAIEILNEAMLILTTREVMQIEFFFSQWQFVIFWLFDDCKHLHEYFVHITPISDFPTTS